MPELGVGRSVDPMEALKAYLANREDLREIEASMLQAAQQLLSNEETLKLDTIDPDAELELASTPSNLEPIEDQDTQLRLL
jgi:exonuclease SbcD